MCLAVAYCFLLTFGQTAAPLPEKPEKALEVIRQLDMIVAKEKDSAVPALIETIKSSELLGQRVQQRIQVETVTTKPDGSLLVSGYFVRPGGELPQYKTKAERDEIAKFNLETQRMNADKLRYAKDLSGVVESERSKVKRDRTRSWQRWKQDRNKAQGEMHRRINAAAEQRKEYCTRIDVELHLPIKLAQQLDKPKLARARSARITFMMNDVDIHPSLDELDEPPRIGEVKGKVVEVDDKYLVAPSQAPSPKNEKNDKNPDVK